MERNPLAWISLFGGEGDNLIVHVLKIYNQLWDIYSNTLVLHIQQQQHQQNLNWIYFSCFTPIAVCWKKSFVGMDTDESSG